MKQKRMAIMKQKTVEKLLYELYLAASEVLLNAVEADDTVHPTYGYVYNDIAELRRALNNVETWRKGFEVELVVDQYGDSVPDDLVCLPNVAQSREMEHDGEERDGIVLFHMDWFEVRGVGLLLAPRYQVPPSMVRYFRDLGGSYLDETGDRVGKLQVDYVEESLRRYNYDDGFYHE